MSKTYTQDYVKLIIEQSSIMLKEESSILLEGTHKEWVMTNAVVLESLNMAHKVFNTSQDNEERVKAFVLIEAILEEYMINVLPDESITTIH